VPALSNQPSERLLHLYLLDLLDGDGVSASATATASAAPPHIHLIPLYMVGVSTALDPFPFLWILCVLLITLLYGCPFCLSSTVRLANVYTFI